MKYTAKQIAEYVIGFCLENGNPISNLQLQKILFFIQGEYYRNTGSFLMDDDFYAWPLGPVVADVYEEYCVYGSGKIFENTTIDLAQDVKAIIDPIIEKRSRQSATQLVNESHKVGGAWRTVFDGNKATIIPKFLIMQEFKK